MFSECVLLVLSLKTPITLGVENATLLSVLYTHFLQAGSASHMWVVLLNESCNKEKGILQILLRWLCEENFDLAFIMIALD